MRILVTRAADDARQIVPQIAALGHQPLLAPVIEIVALGHEAPDSDFDAIVATSTHAFLAFGPGAVLPLDKPLFAVGERTAAAAAASGFRDIRVAAGDAAALAGLVLASLPGPTRLLYLAARDRKATLESDLAAAGHVVTVLETYEARAVETWEQQVVELLRAKKVDAALHFSRRSAALALQLAHRHDIQAEVLALHHYCLSDDVAAPLRAMDAAVVDVAAQPDAAHILRLLTPPQSRCP